MNLPRNPDPFLLKGFSLRQLYEGDKAQMMRMQDEVLSTLADPAWFFPLGAHAATAATPASWVNLRKIPTIFTMCWCCPAIGGAVCTPGF